MNTVTSVFAAGLTKIFRTTFFLLAFQLIVFAAGGEYDVNYYSLKLNIKYNPAYLSGEAEIAFTTVEKLNSIELELSNYLGIDSIVFEGNHLSSFRSNGILTVNFPTIIPQNSKKIIKICYRGIPTASGMGSIIFSTNNNYPLIWTLSEPYGAKDWFPCKNVPVDKADSTKTIITVPQELTAVSNGLLVSEVNNFDGTITYTWKSQYPISSYLISLAIAPYRKYEQYYKYSTTDSMPVVHYLLPSDMDANIPNLNKTTDMLACFSKLFGEYPFIKEKYGHAQMGRGGGMEHQTISSMGSFGEVLIAHELAHQWFGDKVTCRNWSNIWLNEGFATYSVALWFEMQKDTSALNSYLTTQFLNAANAKGSLFVKDTMVISELFDGLRSYSKGAVVLHMLRGITGDSLFFKSLRKYLTAPGLSYNTAVTEDLKKVFNEVTGSDLSYFFNEWVYGENYPKYSFNWSVSTASAGYNLTISLAQSINTTPSFFTMPVDILIKYSNRDTVVTVFNDKSSQKFEFNLNEMPINVVLDPYNKILKDVFNESNPYPDKFSLEQNFPNPFNSMTKITFFLSRLSKVNLSVYDLNGEKVKELINEEVTGGVHSIIYNPENISSGVYFVRLKAGDYTETRKMVYLK